MRLAAVSIVKGSSADSSRLTEPDRVPSAADEVAARPKIVFGQRLAETVDLAEALLLANPSLELYVRGGQLVQVVRSRESDPSDPTRVVRVGAEVLRECLDRSGEWFRGGGSGEPVPALPPMWAASTLLARSRWMLPGLEGISTTPILCGNGMIQDQPGYDFSTGIYFEPNGTEFPPMPAYPSREDAVCAWQALREPFEDFRFVDESDLSALLATLLAILARNVIDGPCPLTAIRAPLPGAGKGLAADAIAMIATGGCVARMSAPRDDDEMRKRILSIGIEARPVVLLDNVVGTFGSPSIAAALTSNWFSDRLLGVSQTMTVPMRAVWMLTGNNVSFRDDLGRRVMPCDLDPKCEHPEERDGFRHPHLLGYVAEHRAELVVAGLTLLRAYLIADRPSHGKPKMGSFEAWDDLVRGALLWDGAADPLDGRRRLREAGDTELEALRNFLGAWWGKYRSQGKTLVSALLENESDAEFRGALAEVAKCEPGQLTSTRLGYAFRTAVGRIVSGLRLERDATLSGGVTRWRVVAVDGRGDRGDRGDVSPAGNSVMP